MRNRLQLLWHLPVCLLENVVCEAWIESAPLVCLESMFNESCAKQVSDIDNNIKNNIFFMTQSLLG